MLLFTTFATFDHQSTSTEDTEFALILYNVIKVPPLVKLYYELLRSIGLRAVQTSSGWRIQPGCCDIHGVKGGMVSIEDESETTVQLMARMPQ